MPRDYTTTSPVVRFWQKVSVDADGCWLWLGALHDSGYGIMQRGRRGEGVVRAHRFSWEIHHGAIPADMSVLHRCDVRACVRPDHLFLGTKADNSRDMAEKNRWRNQTTLSERDVSVIKRDLRLGRVRRDIAATFGVTRDVIDNIAAGRCWARVPEAQSSEHTALRSGR